MHLILGGASQGKLNWYLQSYPVAAEEVEDGDTLPLDTLPQKKVLNHLHRWIYRMEQMGIDPAQQVRQYLAMHPDAVILCDEIGCGVVPLDPKERQWRESTGRICCELAKEAQRIDRIFCGIAMRLK